MLLMLTCKVSVFKPLTLSHKERKIIKEERASEGLMTKDFPQGSHIQHTYIICTQTVLVQG